MIEYGACCPGQLNQSASLQSGAIASCTVYQSQPDNPPRNKHCTSYETHHVHSKTMKHLYLSRISPFSRSQFTHNSQSRQSACFVQLSLFCGVRTQDGNITIIPPNYFTATEFPQLKHFEHTPSFDNWLHTNYCYLHGDVYVNDSF